MNPLFTTAAFFLNYGALFVVWKFLFLWGVTFLPAGAPRDGLLALVL